MTSRKMKSSGVFLLMLLLLLAIVERPALVEAGPGDCLDACQTGCVASYLPDMRKVSRCERKCSIKCPRPGAGHGAANMGGV